MSVEEKISGYLIRDVLMDASARIDPSASLLAAGTIDSTGVMDLVMFLEKEFAIRVADDELVPENLDSVERISRFVERKVAARNGQH